MSRTARLARLVLFDDAAFDAAFGALDISGRGPAQWLLLADAVEDDVRGVGGASGSFSARVLPSLGIEPPTRLRPPRLAAPRPWVRPVAVGSGLALAALALFALRAPPQGDPLLLVPRGASGPGEQLAAPLDVAVAVKSASGTTRLDVNAAYAVGDTLVFQVTLPLPATVELRRAAAGDLSASVLWSGPLDAGLQTLPVGYAFDAGDSAAIFQLTARGPAGTMTRALSVAAPRGSQ